MRSPISHVTANRRYTPVTEVYLEREIDNERFVSITNGHLNILGK